MGHEQIEHDVTAELKNVIFHLKRFPGFLIMFKSLVEQKQSLPVLSLRNATWSPTRGELLMGEQPPPLDG